MSRGVRGVDRTVAVVLGLALLVVGAALAVWAWAGPSAVDRLGVDAPDAVDAGGVTDTLEASWWTGVAAAAAVVIGVLALWWLIAHLPRRASAVVVLPSATPGSRLRLDGAAVARAAATDLEASRAVRDARGVIAQHEVLVLVATVEPTAELATTVSDVEESLARAAQVLSVTGYGSRVIVKVARRGRALTRVD
ncbi:conserved hypothetical protein [Beutenbergia cavernae DSM 12333]|uniref:Alkaline shock response membrane anchor protein AmaP n=1 Tax=Beutenbergia cavernae (strain ATCC BAA-8 / DSM 12333 / CCUG 43141 / JCM 11478 / NBRC 16432 / NCIMB 13614 / HKI 0122) TaxID=471853 RepID=C5C279_BEUC1|nr:hypothetical protein [Beutenbergia cavernae]ACQ81704.1 conserved hypothetical protein [Beutenbergia cavernae DSM 12333]